MICQDDVFMVSSQINVCKLSNSTLSINVNPINFELERPFFRRMRLIYIYIKKIHVFMVSSQINVCKLSNSTLSINFELECPFFRCD